MKRKRFLALILAGAMMLQNGLLASAEEILSIEESAIADSSTSEETSEYSTNEEDAFIEAEEVEIIINDITEKSDDGILAEDAEFVLSSENESELYQDTDYLEDGFWNEESEELAAPNEYASTVDSGTCGDNLTWVLDEAGTLTISGSGAMTSYSSSEHSPWRYKKIKTVVINSNVTSIGGYAFSNCNSLTSISIPSSVTSIGGYAFSNCNSLTSISIPSSVTSIGASVFINCSNLTSINIPSSVTSIGYSAFWGCSSLTSISIPSGVTSIADNTFLDCSSLISISIPSSVTSIGGYAFAGCSSLASISIPSSVTSIGDYAFSGCSNLTSINIPSSVINIGDYAFSRCSNLTSISIPSSVISIGSYAFSYCSSLTDVYYSGSEAEWNAIRIYNNGRLTNVTIHYNSTGPSGGGEIQKTFEIQAITPPVAGQKAVIGGTYTAATTGKVSEELAQIVWTTSAPSIAIVYGLNAGINDPSNTKSTLMGTLEAFKPGTVTITGTSPDGRTASAEIVVEPELIAGDDAILTEETAVTICSVMLEEANAEYLKSFLSQIEVELSGNDLFMPISLNASSIQVADNGLSAKLVYDIEPLTDGDSVLKITSPNGQEKEMTVTVTGKGVPQLPAWNYTDEWSFKNYGVSPIPLTDTDYQAITTGAVDNSAKEFIDKKIKSGGKNGQCYGMALISILVNKSFLPLNTIQPGIEYLYNAEKSESVKSAIGYYFLHQYTTGIDNARAVFKSLPLKDQLEKLVSSADPYLLEFEADGWGAHGIVATGVDMGTWRYHGHTYDTRIKTYDSNYGALTAKAEGSYLYFNSETLEWEIPNYYKNGISSDGNGCLRLACSDYKLLTNWDLAEIRGDRAALLSAETDGDFSVSLNDKVYAISGENSAVEGVFDAYYDIGYLEGSTALPTLNLAFQELSDYTVLSDGNSALDVSVLYPNYFVSAAASACDQVTMKQNGGVTAAGLSGIYDFYVTSDERCSAIAWDTVEVSGSGATEISLELTDQGILVTGDNLENVTVSGKNDTIEKEISVSSAQDNILISENNGEIIVSEDTDGDGVYETDITKEEPEKHNHIWNSGVVTKTATCTAAGVKTYTCTGCGATKTETLAAKGHTWGSWTPTSAATVFAPEQQTHRCSVCQSTETRSTGNKLSPAMSLNASSLKLKKGQSTTALKVSGMANGDSVKSVASNKTRILKVVSYNASGSIKLKAQKKTGTAKLTITLASGLSKTISVKVQSGTVKTTKIKVNTKQLTLKKGDTATLATTVTPITSQQKVTYTSSNKKVATVSSKGVIKAKKAGTAKITVKSGSKKATVKIKVTK